MVNPCEKKTLSVSAAVYGRYLVISYHAAAESRPVVEMDKHVGGLAVRCASHEGPPVALMYLWRAWKC